HEEADGVRSVRRGIASKRPLHRGQGKRFRAREPVYYARESRGAIHDIAGYHGMDNARWHESADILESVAGIGGSESREVHDRAGRVFCSNSIEVYRLRY